MQARVGRTRWLRARLLLGGGLVAVAALAGCGGGGGGATGAGGGPAAKVGGGAAAQDQAEFGLPGAEIERRQIRVEDLIKTCMKSQGFDYVPVDPATLRAAMDSNSKPNGLSEKDFRKQYGYGIATLYEAQLKQAQASQGQPNQRIRSALAPAQQVAYDRTLYGANPSATFAAALDSEDLSQIGGCTKKAVDQVFPAQEVRRLVRGSQDAIGELALQDPRVVEATRAWSDCMRRAGFTYANPDEVETALKDRLAAVVGGASKPAPVGATPAAPYDRAALAALQRDEVSVAVADYGCAAKGLKKTKDAVEAELAKAQGG